MFKTLGSSSQAIYFQTLLQEGLQSTNSRNPWCTNVMYIWFANTLWMVNDPKVLMICNIYQTLDCIKSVRTDGYRQQICLCLFIDILAHTIFVRTGGLAEKCKQTNQLTKNTYTWLQCVHSLTVVKLVMLPLQIVVSSALSKFLCHTVLKYQLLLYQSPSLKI